MRSQKLKLGIKSTFIYGIACFSIGMSAAMFHDSARSAFADSTNAIVSGVSRDPKGLFDSLKTKIKNWGLFNFQGPAHIQVIEAWKIHQAKKSVVVAVIDTGIDPSHPNLKSRLWRAEGAADSAYGFNFVTNQPNPNDEHGHGTHVAGIVGAVTDPLTGVSGVSQDVLIMPIKYYSDKNTGAQNLTNTVKAIRYAVDHGAKIINYSGGGPEFSAEEYAAIQDAERKGVLFVAAAGNDASDIDEKKNYYFPSSYRLPNIISVAANDIRGRLLSSSNYGKARVDVSAPGEQILSTLPGAKTGVMTGTSQATAFVTGIAALVWSEHPELTYTEVKSIIMDSVDTMSTLSDKTVSGGKVNALNALTLMKRRFDKPVKVLTAQNQLDTVLKQAN